MRCFIQSVVLTASFLSWNSAPLVWLYLPHLVFLRWRCRLRAADHFLRWRVCSSGLWRVAAHNAHIQRDVRITEENERAKINKHTENKWTQRNKTMNSSSKSWNYNLNESRIFDNWTFSKKSHISMQPRLLDTVSESLRLWSDEHNRNDLVTLDTSKRNDFRARLRIPLLISSSTVTSLVIKHECLHTATLILRSNHHQEV